MNEEVKVTRVKNDVFEDILRRIKLPFGVLLTDRSTYRIIPADFTQIPACYTRELPWITKILILTDGQDTVVGGVLFYGDTDIQATVFPEYRGKHFMSAIHKNGILMSECYPNQRVNVDTNNIVSFDDFLMKHYLLSCAGLRITNLAEIHEYFNHFYPCDKLKGFQQYSKEDFMKMFA